MKKNYLSKEGHERLEKELRDLKTRGRKEIAAELSEARSKGELRENAEYDAAKEAQGHWEKKIAEIEHTLATATIIAENNMHAGKTDGAATVTIRNEKPGK